VNEKNNTNITHRAGLSTFDYYIHVKNEYGFKYIPYQSHASLIDKCYSEDI
jgi:hypothetical protein